MRFSFGNVILIFSILLILLLTFFMIQISSKSIEAREKLNCANYFIYELDDLNNYYKLCDNDECKEYFKTKMERYVSYVGTCLEINQSDVNVSKTEEKINGF